MTLVIPQNWLADNISPSVVQLELHTHEQLDKAWRRLAKRDAKQAQSDPDHVPAAQQPEAVFLPQMLDEFLQVGPGPANLGHKPCTKLP